MIVAPVHPATLVPVASSFPWEEVVTGTGMAVLLVVGLVQVLRGRL